jgi:hypothetical protein
MLAAGLMLMVAAPLTSSILLVAGGALAAVAVTAWINELRHESGST